MHAKERMTQRDEDKKQAIINYPNTMPGIVESRTTGEKKRIKVNYTEKKQKYIYRSHLDRKEGQRREQKG